MCPFRCRLVYLVHWPICLNPKGNHPNFPTRPDGTRDVLTDWPISKTWEQMEALVKKGKVRSIGVSNCSEKILEQLLPLAGDVLWVYGPYNEFTANSTFTIAYSPIGTKPGTYIPWVWPEDLSIFIPNIMQNVSLSLLSGVLSDTRNNTIGSQDTTCRTYGLQYVYDRTRLLATYGAALLLTAVFLILGILTSHNGRVESFGFTRVLAAYPLDKTLTLDTQVVVGNDGRLDESRT